MDEAPDPQETPEPASLRLLRRLVTTLTVVMILGVITLVGLLVIRLGAPPTRPTLPEQITLPAGEEARAVTFGTGWYAVVSQDGQGVERLRLYALDGTALQDVPLP